jgi:hypothetical protein
MNECPVDRSIDRAMGRMIGTRHRDRAMTERETHLIMMYVRSSAMVVDVRARV